MRVPVSGAVLDGNEKSYLHKAVDTLWLTEGKWCKQLEKNLEEFTGKREAILVNSGSSANLLSLTSLELKPGDEVITTLLNFPTTVNPIIQNNLIPVFIDVTIPELVVDLNQIESAISPKTKAIVLAHTLGYPVDIKSVRYLCKKYNLKLVEDCCDALGTEDIMEGDLSTLSFYPAHQMTTGEGGSILTDNLKLAKIIRSYRDWGRDCWCLPGEDNTCGIRFNQQFDSLPEGYDHKYVYSRIGYNMKMTEFQAAIGVAQSERLYDFVAKRKLNHAYLYANLKDLEEYFILPPVRTDVSWFGFGLLCKKPIERLKITRWLDEQGVMNRPMFAGNILRQPAYQNINYKQMTDGKNTNYIHDNGFWIGCFPGLSVEQLDYSISKIHEYVKERV